MDRCGDVGKELFRSNVAFFGLRRVGQRRPARRDPATVCRIFCWIRVARSSCPQVAQMFLWTQPGGGPENFDRFRGLRECVLGRSGALRGQTIFWGPKRPDDVLGDGGAANVAIL
jgi:hypothetical protein